MTKQILINGESYGDHRSKLNDNFTELYDASFPVAESVNQTIFIAPDGAGNNETGDGTESNPYATLDYAKTTISTDVQSTIMFMMMPGTHTLTDRSLDLSNFTIIHDHWSSYISIIGQYALVDTCSLTKVSMWDYVDASKSWAPDELRHKFLTDNMDTTAWHSSIPIRSNTATHITAHDVGSSTNIVELATVLKSSTGRDIIAQPPKAVGSREITCTLEFLKIDAEGSSLELSGFYTKGVHFRSYGSSITIGQYMQIHNNILESRYGIQANLSDGDHTFFDSCMFNRVIPETAADNNSNWFKNHHFMDVGAIKGLLSGYCSFQYCMSCMTVYGYSTGTTSTTANILLKDCGAFIGVGTNLSWIHGRKNAYGSFTCDNTPHILWAVYGDRNILFDLKYATVTGISPEEITSHGGGTNMTFEMDALDGSGIVTHNITNGVDFFPDNIKCVDPAKNVFMSLPGVYPEVGETEYLTISDGSDVDVKVGNLYVRSMELKIEMDGTTEFATAKIVTINSDNTGNTLHSNAAIESYQSGSALNPKLSGTGGVVFTLSKDVGDDFNLNISNVSGIDIKATLNVNISKKQV